MALWRMKHWKYNYKDINNTFDMCIKRKNEWAIKDKLEVEGF
jgi:hypothetical protein